MNYLWGAVNRASQYYKELPPINPSTLTGAIDVIVVRRQEGDDTILACSPFHVRFGKWQILRPGDKKVVVTVNNHPIPFDMKIGEAGEAFFVIETEDEVPEDLITSPILSPVETPVRELERLQGPSRQELDEPQDSDTDPEPLSLDDPPDVQKFASTTDDASRKEETPTQHAVGLLHMAMEFGRAAGKVAIETQRGEAEHIQDQLELTSRRAAAGLKHLRNLSLENLLGPGQSDEEMLEDVAGDSGAPPEVRLTKDVAFDTEGYHVRESTDDTARPDERNVDAYTPSVKGSIQSPLSRRRAAPSLRLATARDDESRINSHLPYGEGNTEYQWEWGSFPMRTPKPLNADANWSDLPPKRPTSAPVTADHLVNDDDHSAAPFKFGEGARLVADESDIYKFLLHLSGSVLSFELSLCGPLDRSQGEVSAAQRFQGKLVTYRAFIKDPSIVTSPELVIRWDDKYVSRDDMSPLTESLVKWRQDALKSHPVHSDEEPLSSSDEKETVELRQVPQKSPIQPRRSTWARWWNRSQRNGGTKSQGPPLPPTTIRRENDRPKLAPAASEPSGVVRAPEPRRSATMQMETQPPSSEEAEDPASAVGKRFVKTLRLTSDQLKRLDLKPGPNTIKFSLSATGVTACTARIFLWESSDLIVISDIDGTITKSDALGHMFNMIGRDWTHLGIAKLYTDIVRNGYKMMYLTSRAIGQADSTREYLKGISQNNYQLPEGPVIMSPDRLLASLHREVIMRKPEVFKMACLRDIQRLFGAQHPFYAGFGNRITDAMSYRSVSVDSAKIFTIDSTGVLKMELMEYAGYTSSYIHMTDIVDLMFPPMNKTWKSEYTDNNYWRPPLGEFELPDLPPSPALTAVSDNSNTSTFQRLRYLSLGRSSSRPASISSTPRERSPAADDRAKIDEAELRKISSFARLTTRLSSPDIEEETLVEPEGWAIPHVRNSKLSDEDRANRRKSLGSMPGSLPGSLEATNLSDSDYEGSTSEKSGELGDEDEYAAEDAFDDDILAAGEMQNVPFL